MISAARLGIVAALAALLWIVTAGPPVPAFALAAAAAVAWCRWLEGQPSLTSQDPHD
jgi:hypothetical protein